MKALFLWWLTALSLALMLLSGCVVRGGYEDYGAAYYEPPVEYYGYWGPGYYVAPYRDRDHFEREHHEREHSERTFRPAPATRPIPTIPSNPPFRRLR